METWRRSGKVEGQEVRSLHQQMGGKYPTASGQEGIATRLRYPQRNSESYRRRQLVKVPAPKFSRCQILQAREVGLQVIDTPCTWWGVWDSKACRKTVLQLGHEIPLAGHLGVEKTQRRILRLFYWPTVFKDIEDFCDKCQKSINHKVPRAPLMPLPIIIEWFSKIAVDIVGLLPQSRSYNHCVDDLRLCH